MPRGVGLLQGCFLVELRALQEVGNQAISECRCWEANSGDTFKQR